MFAYRDVARNSPTPKRQKHIARKKTDITIICSEKVIRFSNSHQKYEGLMNYSDGLRVFVRHSDFFGHPPIINEIYQELSRFNLQYLTIMLGQINAVLFQDIPPTEDIQGDMVRSFFDEDYFQIFRDNPSPIPNARTHPILFNSHQCLWLLKHATQVSKPR